MDVSWPTGGGYMHARRPRPARGPAAFGLEAAVRSSHAGLVRSRALHRSSGLRGPPVMGCNVYRRGTDALRPVFELGGGTDNISVAGRWRSRIARRRAGVDEPDGAAEIGRASCRERV